jgi:CBS domain containing-hemolysin-like protein
VGDLPEDREPGPATPTAERVDENTYRLSGNLSVRLWADRLAFGEVERHVHTIAGLILAKLGRLPRPGESVRIRNLKLTVEVVRSRRIETVLVKRDPDNITPPEATVP